MALVEWIELAAHEHESGTLVVAEGNINVPFTIQRVYCLVGLDPSQRRGSHAHKDLQQVAFCLHGSCSFLLDNGQEREEVVLNRPSIGLLIRSLTWREMFNFSTDCVLMVLASRHYDENDYIRDYEEFKNAVE